MFNYNLHVLIMCILSDFLCAEKEKQSRVYIACDSSWLYAYVGMVWCQVYTR